MLVEAPEDISRAAAVCRSWRAAANSDDVWRAVGALPGCGLLAALKARPQCKKTWRELYIQRTLADRQLPAPAKVKPRADEYLLGIEVYAHCGLPADDGYRPPRLLLSTLAEGRQDGGYDFPAVPGGLLVEASDLAPSECHLDHIPAGREDVFVNAVLVRKADDKILTLENGCRADPEEFVEGEFFNEFFNEFVITIDQNDHSSNPPTHWTAHLGVLLSSCPVPGEGCTCPRALAPKNRFLCKCDDSKGARCQLTGIALGTLNFGTEVLSHLIDHPQTWSEGDIPMCDLLEHLESPSFEPRWV